jgi:hypothetical protein
MTWHEDYLSLIASNKGWSIKLNFLGHCYFLIGYMKVTTTI